jgi:anti-anti-sigma factor
VSAPLAEVVSEREGDLTVLAVSGEVDLSNVDEIATAIRRCVPTSQDLLLDLGGVEYLDSAAIAMLDGLRQAGIVAHVVAPPECAAARLLAMVDLGVPTYADRANAAAALQARRSGSAGH